MVVKRARKLAWQIDVVVNDYFKMNLGQLGIREQNHEGRFVFVELILRDVVVVDQFRNAQLLDHLRLRKPEALPNLQQLLSQSSWTWSRAPHIRTREHIATEN